VAANNATAARIQLASEQLGQVQAEADAASVDVVQKAAKIRRTDSQRQASERDLIRAKAEAKIRTGKSTISSASVDKLEKTLHKKRESILDRQQALLQAQYQVLDSGKSNTTPKPEAPKPEKPKPESGPENGVLSTKAVMRSNGSNIMSTGKAKLKLQADGNLVLYGTKERHIWASGTYGKGVGPYFLIMQPDGNLVMYDSKSAVIWHTNTYGQGTQPHRAVVQADGNFVVYDSKNAVLWQSNTRLLQWYPTVKKKKSRNGIKIRHFNFKGRNIEHECVKACEAEPTCYSIDMDTNKGHCNLYRNHVGEKNGSGEFRIRLLNRFDD